MVADSSPFNGLAAGLIDPIAAIRTGPRSPKRPQLARPNSSIPAAAATRLLSFGLCGVERIAAICKRHNVILIEDTAQANGASFHGKPLGSFGDLAIFSFQYNKNVTSGEGGLVVSNRDDLGNRAWAYHDMGYSRNEKGRVDPNGIVLLTSAAYRDEAGPEYHLAKEKALFLSKFAHDIIKEKVPDLVPHLQILTGFTDMDTRKFEVIERIDAAVPVKKIKTA